MVRTSFNRDVHVKAVPQPHAIANPARSVMVHQRGLPVAFDTEYDAAELMLRAYVPANEGLVVVRRLTNSVNGFRVSMLDHW